MPETFTIMVQFRDTDGKLVGEESFRVQACCYQDACGEMSTQAELMLEEFGAKYFELV